MYPLLWRVALVVTRSSEGAEEVLQDVFCTLWTRRERLDSDMDIRVYLAAAVRNRAHDLGRHQTMVSAIEQAVGQWQRC